MYFFFFKQKTAYEMRISDWSSDVCSSDLSIMTEAPPRTVKWLDLAEYGLQLVMMRLPSGTSILVLGGGSRYPKQAQALGFAKDAKTGFYTQTLRNLDIVAWRRQFPKVMVKDMALETITRSAGVKNRPVGREPEEAIADRESPQSVQGLARPVLPEGESVAPVHVAMAQSRRLGLNAAGHEVFEGADGRYSIGRSEEHTSELPSLMRI